MQKVTYTKRQYKRQFTGSRAAIAPAPAMAEPLVPAQQAHSKRAGYLVFSLCLVLAVLAVMFVPLLARGETAVSASAGAALTQQAENAVAYNSVEEAVAVLGFNAALPTLPQGAAASAVRVLDGKVLEVSYQLGKDSFVYRTAQGNDDISGDTHTYAFSTTEEAGGVARSYQGPTEKFLNLAVWAAGGNTYAIVAEGGLAAETLKEIAQSIV